MINNYEENIIYSGNLIQYIDGKLITLKNDLYLLYDKETDSFYSYIDTFNYQIDLKLKNNLTSEEIEEYKKIIEKYRYPYTPNIIEGQPYIDQSTIKLAINNKKR